MTKEYLLAIFFLLFLVEVHSQSNGYIPVSGACEMCKERIENNANQVIGIESVDYSIDDQLLRFTYDEKIFDIRNLHQRMVDSGHDTNLKKADEDIYNELAACCQYRSNVGGLSKERTDQGERKVENGKDPLKKKYDPRRKSIVKGSIHSIDENGELEALIGVNIRWEGAPIGAVTNLEGEFEIGRISSTDVLIVSYVGYNSDTLDFSGINEVEWIMTSGIKLTDIEVLYRNKSSSVSFINPIHVIEMSEDELCKAACCSLSESFETNPSIDATFTDAITGTRQIQMLGLAGKYVQITSELIPNVRSLAVLEGLDYIPGAWIESIQLSKGTGSVVQGYESMTGQINVEMRKPQTKERFYLNLYTNQEGRTEANLIVKQKVNSNLSTAVLLHGKSHYQKHDNNHDDFSDHPLGSNFYIQNKWRYKNDNGWRSRLSLKYVKQDAYSGNIAFDPDFSSGTSDLWGFKKDVERWEGWFKLGKVINQATGSSFGIQLSGKIYEGNRKFGERIYEASENNLFANILYENISSSQKHKVKSGVSFTLDEVDENLGQQVFGFQERVGGIYSEYTYLPNENFTLVGGVRLDLHNEYGMMFIPRLHLRYAVNSNSVFRLTGGKGWRTPRVFAENVGMFASNRDWIILSDSNNLPYGLEQEVNWNFGGSWTYSFSKSQKEGILSLDYYYTYFENQIVADFESDNRGTVILSNQEEPTVGHSFQAQMDYELIPKLDIRLAYRFNISKAIFGDEEKTIPFNSFHRAFLNLGYEMGTGWFFDATISWNGKQRIPGTEWMSEDNRLEEETEEYFILMGQVRKVFNKNFELYVGGENLLDYKLDNPIVSSFDTDSKDFDASLVWAPVFGRNIYAGLRYRFD